MQDNSQDPLTIDAISSRGIYIDFFPFPLFCFSIDLLFMFCLI